MASERYRESNSSVDEQDQLIVRQSRGSSVPLLDLSKIEDVSITEAMKELVFAALPYAGSFIINSSGKIITYIILKTYNNDILTGAYGISSNFINVLSSAIFLALNIGLLAKISPAYGARHYKMIGYYLHRAFVIRLLIYLLVATVLFFSIKIFTFIGYNEQLAEDVGTYLVYSIPGVFFYMIFYTFNYYLIGMKIFFPGATAQIIGAFVYILFAFILILGHQMGIKGAAIAQNITYFVMAVIITSYIFIKNPVDQTLFWFDQTSFDIKDIWNQFTTEIAVGSMVSVKLTAIEIIGIMSGFLNQAQMAAYEVTLACVLSFYGMPFSLSNALISFIGASFGQEKLKKARSYFNAGLLTTLGSVLICISILIIFAKDIAAALLPNIQAIIVAIVLFHMFCILIPIDFFQLAFGAALRVLGKQKSGTISIAVSMFCIGVPTAYVLAFVGNLGAEGLVWGLGAGYLGTFIGYLWIYFRLDWEIQMEVVKEILHRDSSRAGVEKDHSEWSFLSAEDHLVLLTEERDFY